MLEVGVSIKTEKQKKFNWINRLEKNLIELDRFKQY